MDRNPDQSYYPREIAEAIDFRATQIRESLLYLLRQRLIIRTGPDGKAKYQLNHQYEMDLR